MVLAAGQLHMADQIVLIGYFLVMLGIGAYFYRFMRRMRDYFSGGNAIPWWLSGASFYMSSFSVFGFVVYSALAYQYGWVAITIFWSYIPGRCCVPTCFPNAGGGRASTARSNTSKPGSARRCGRCARGTAFPSRSSTMR
jgi:hypothetical protein